MTATALHKISLARTAGTTILLLALGLGFAPAQEKRGLGKLFGKKDAGAETAVVAAAEPAGAEPAPASLAAAQADLATTTTAEQPAGRPTGTEQYPALQTKSYRPSKSEQENEGLIDMIYSEYEAKVLNLTSGDLQLVSLRELPPVPTDYDSGRTGKVRQPFWSQDKQFRQDLVQVYGRALQHSNAIKVFSDLPLIRETAIQEALGDYDWRAFAQGQYNHTNEPTSSELTTGFTGRFLEDLGQLDYGLKKRIATGGEFSISNRLSTLDSNSTFLDPNPQSASEVVISFVQPLGRGAGFAYNRARIKVAKLEADLAAAEYLRALETHLLDVNRAYWEVYLARAAFLQKRSLVTETDTLVKQLGDRADVDTGATQSALLRAKSTLSQRDASLIRSEMAIRNSEEKLRALLNDPDFAMGSGGEFIPLTQPITGQPISDVQTTARAALYHRPEIVQGFAALRAAGLRLDLQKSDAKPQLNLVLEGRKSGNDANRRFSGAYDDMASHGAGWLAGFTYEQPLENRAAIAGIKRREYELRQQVNQLRSNIDQVLLEAVVTYRELMTAYRDMQGRYQAVLATRVEVEELKARLDVDTDDQKTVGDQIQLILDALERLQAAEESFLVSLVAYNTAFASVERAKGTLLEYYDVDIARLRDESYRRHRRALDTLNASMGSVDYAVQMDNDPRWSRHNKALEALKAKSDQ